jgi:predicted secreted protein
MGWFTATVLFALIWWTVLFAVLPLGTRTVDQPDATSGWRGTPANPRIGRKVLLTTVIAVLIWGGCVLVITSPWLSFRSGWLALPDR